MNESELLPAQYGYEQEIDVYIYTSLQFPSLQMYLSNLLWCCRRKDALWMHLFAFDKSTSVPTVTLQRGKAYQPF